MPHIGPGPQVFILCNGWQPRCWPALHMNDRTRFRISSQEGSPPLLHTNATSLPVAPPTLLGLQEALSTLAQPHVLVFPALCYGLQQRCLYLCSRYPLCLEGPSLTRVL